MTQPANKNCPYCAEEIRSAAKICRFCNRAVAEAKLCEFCCEPLRLAALKCRFCGLDQAQMPQEKHPPVTGIVPASLSFGFQPAQSPVYQPQFEPIEPKKIPEQCHAEEEFKEWQKRRMDAIKYGAKHD